MIISRTPFRISFAGGGTDLRSYYSKDPGRVLSATINKYIYVVVKRQIGIVEFKYRINWSRVEFTNNIDDIEHPIVREALRMIKIDFPIEITTFADIPAQTGLGSSSAFTVGLVHALYALKGKMVTKYDLATIAANIEVEMVGRVMGKQDHFASAYGGLNIFTFYDDDKVKVDPVFYRPEVHTKLEKNLMLFYTKIKRDASEVLTVQNKETNNKMDILRQVKDLVDPLNEVLSNGKELYRVGEILHQGWMLKKKVSNIISNRDINDYYDRARNEGAIGGKLLGAGSGGFLLFYVEPDKRIAVRKELKELYCMDIGLDTGGTRITYYDQTKF